MTPAQKIACAPHCPLPLAEDILKGEAPWARGVLYFGPFRCWYSKQCGWILDGSWVGKATIGARWRRETCGKPCE